MAQALINSDSSQSAQYAASVTPSDSADLTYRTRAIYVGGDGSVVASIGGTNVTFVGVVAGTVLPIQADRILSTGTTATNIVALW